MDKDLKRRLQELREEVHAFHSRQLEVCRVNRERRWAYYSAPLRFRPLTEPQLYKQEARPEHLRGIPCGATTGAGTPCKLTTLFSNGRCIFHGGHSTGAKTKAGRKCQRDGYLPVWQSNWPARSGGNAPERIPAMCSTSLV